MAPNWKALAPHRPLDPGEAGYVSPPSGYAERVARLVETGTSTVLVGGPVGVGKSTELARIASLLRDTRVACLVQLDRYENIRRLTADQMLLRLAGKIVEYASATLRIRPSMSLVAALSGAGVASPSVLGGMQMPAAPFTGSPLSLLQAARDEVTRRAHGLRLAVICDGLEKMPESAQSLEVLATLGQLGDDIDIIAAVPWFVAFGAAEDIIRPGALFAPVPVCEVDGPQGPRGCRFLADILAERLGMTPGALAAAERARPGLAQVVELARWSGGLPRTFLQLAADAAQYAQIRRGDDWPDERDLADAVSDQRDSFRRALLPGDTDAIRAVQGTDGREMELDRKIRLLARGIILERQRGDRWVMDVHPLVLQLLGGSRGA
ncbi:hypothetical protein [Nannocystis pusilla]|uniref:Orc1-like AAA ATPase domain-containing protein n=1 Tax=Nannocystis pusilla TaxID=889268 RepID=A0ABS7U198_9BACT|nr:hypothetical protein [Nannocystis pusilla]MBZ5714122.1 hypothetical protein [Nannocystis pusilla]